MKVFSSLAKSALAVAAASAVISIARADAAPAVPTSAYAQSGSANLLLQLDAIDNAGAGVHEASPATWVNLAGGSIALDKNGANDLAFDDDAWAADGSCYFKTTSDDVKSALTGNAAAFTVELVISHPSTQNQYENWVYLGNSGSRALTIDLRSGNSQNPLVQGVQYRATKWDSAASVAKGTKTGWDKRQYIAVVCNGTTATAYCDGKVQFHSVTGTATPADNQLTIGASPTGSNPLIAGAKVCAVRMTNRILSENERMRNFFVDSQRFGLSDAPDGYRYENGAVQVRVAEGVEGFEFSTDGGTTWAAGAAWAVIDQEVTLAARFAANPSVPLQFDALPSGATVSGNTVTFTPPKPCAIRCSAPPTLEASGAVVWSTGAWTAAAASVSAPASGVAVVNVTGETTLTLDGTVSMESIFLNIASGAKLTLATAAGAAFDIERLVLAGNVALDVPTANLAEGSTLACAGIDFGNGAVLTANSDVRGFGPVQLLSGMLDVNGHVFALEYADGGAATVTSGVEGGALQIEVRGDATVTNTKLALTGGSNLQVWKTGAGTLRMTKVNAGFGGNNVTSLVIKAGIVQRDNSTTTTQTFGAGNSTIVVEDGGQFDIANNCGTVYYDFLLAGAGPDGLGALALRAASISNNGYDSAYSIRHITLSADAAIGTNSKLGLKYTANWADHNITLNGHTLTIANGTVYAGVCTFVGEGKFVIGSTSSFSFYHHNAAAPDCDVAVYGQIVENADASPVAGGFSAVKSLVFEPGSKLYDNKSKHMTNVVYERYAPPLGYTGSYTHLNVVLGSAEHLATTLDLTRFTGAFDGSTTTFQTGSTVTVDLSGRTDLMTIRNSNSPYVVTWSAVPNGVKFAPDDQTKNAGFFLSPEPGGLRLRYNEGVKVIIR